MKHYFIMCVFLMQTLNMFGLSVFTNKGDGGRLGDQILNVIKTYYLSKRHNIPMQLTSFPYSSNFKFSKLLKPYNRGAFKYVQDIGGSQVHYTKSLPITAIKEDTAYRVSYYYVPVGFNHMCLIDTWKDILSDTKFRLELHDFLKVTGPYSSLLLPQDRVSVALHIRRCSGGDFEWFKGCSHEEGQRKQREAYPEKFSPLSYYKKSIKMIYGMIKKPLYVHVFTDDSNPSRLVSMLQKGLQECDIQYGCRVDNNSAEGSCLINDFANMLQFDCLVRSKSNFGQVLQLCKDYDIVIYPEKTEWKDGNFIVSESVVLTNNENYSQD